MVGVPCALPGTGEVWAAGSNGDAQLGLGPEAGAKNAEFRLIKKLQGELADMCTFSAADLLRVPTLLQEAGADSCQGM